MFVPLFDENKGSQAHRRQYGYGMRNALNLDALAERWSSYQGRGWLRPYEVRARVKQPDPSTSPVCINEEFIEDFHRISRDAFRYIAGRHILSPFRMWQKVQQGLRAVAMHEDDVEFCEKFIFGWAEISQEEMERFRWRYPDRCPLLDVLCTLDDTYEELNQFQDKMLELKGSKGRRRLDVIPALPDPDGVRQPPKERVAGSISFSQLLNDGFF